MRKFIWSLLLLAATVTVLYFYKEYNRKPADLLNGKPEFIVTATELLYAFETDEAAANKKYLDKIIQVSGPLAAISNQHDSLISVTIGNELKRVTCLLDKKYAAIVKEYKILDTINTKGICTGYLMDVELNRCVIVQ